MYGSPAVCVNALLPDQPVTWFTQKKKKKKNTHTHTHTHTQNYYFFYNGKIWIR